MAKAIFCVFCLTYPYTKSMEMWSAETPTQPTKNILLFTFVLILTVEWPFFPVFLKCFPLLPFFSAVWGKGSFFEVMFSSCVQRNGIFPCKCSKVEKGTAELHRAELKKCHLSNLAKKKPWHYIPKKKNSNKINNLHTT